VIFAKYAESVQTQEIVAVFESIPAQLAKESKKFKPSEVITGARFGKLRSAIDWLTSAGIAHKVFIANAGELPFSAFTRKTCLNSIWLISAFLARSLSFLRRHCFYRVTFSQRLRARFAKTRRPGIHCCGNRTALFLEQQHCGGRIHA